MMVVLLRRLDEIGATQFHHSKSNGDYLSEYSSEFSGREQFGDFVLTFDRTIYSGGPCGSQMYQDMNTKFSHLCNDVRKKQ